MSSRIDARGFGERMRRMSSFTLRRTFANARWVGLLAAILTGCGGGTGRADAARGLRSFVVGTGGASPYAFETIRANSEARLTGNFGVVRLTLRSDRFQWDFVDIAGVTRDSGEAACH
jgi:hypothetical protein